MVNRIPLLDDPGGRYASRSFSPSGCNPDARCGNGMEKIYPTCAVRYGYMNNIGEFRYAPGMLFTCGAKVVIQTSRGIEIGQQVSLTCSGCDKSVSRQQLLAYVKNSGNAGELYQLKAGRILREATRDDLQEEFHIKEGESAKLLRARESARSVGLDLKLVACEHLFGGERIIFYFMAENRVDFRELVRDLAHEYHTRIEMHQVGARDEARLVADYEICGRECCCKNFLKKLRPITMRMAKLQKATLDPSKVSGRCGRLRCCLRYEHEGYDELNKKLPRVGTRVRTERGIGTIKDRQILTQLLTIAYDDTEYEESVGIEDLLERDLPKGPLPPRRETAVEAGGNAEQKTARSPRGVQAEQQAVVTETNDADVKEVSEQSEEKPGEIGTTAERAASGGAQGQPPQTLRDDSIRPNRSRGRRGRRRRRGRQDGNRPPGDGSSRDGGAEDPGRHRPEPPQSPS